MGVQGQRLFVKVITLIKHFVKVFSPPPPKDTENYL